VPSQDDVLKDNKRCYDNILSECGIKDPLQIYSGWLDGHDHGHGMQFGHREHFVLKIHKLLLLFDLAFKKYPSCSHPLEKYS
jgi:hypothetical protein